MNTHYVEWPCKSLCAAAVAMAVLMAAAANTSVAQMPLGRQFEQICEYGRTFAELNDQWNNNRQLLRKTVDEFEILKQRMRASIADMQSINTVAFQQFQHQLSEYLSMQQLEAEVKNLPKSFRNDATRSDLARNQDLTRASMFNIEQKLAQLGAAERATAERQTKILVQMEANQQQRMQALNNYDRINLTCFEKSDVAGSRSQLENKSVLHALAQADADNLGARLATSIALLRLGQLTETLNMLESLNDAPLPISQIVAGIRGEVYATQRKTEFAKKELGKTNRSSIAAVQILRARTLEILGDSKDAVREWEKLEEHETYQLIAQTCLSINRLSHPNTVQQNAKCLQDCKVVDELAGGQNWMCKIALSMALFANQNAEEAIATAEEASNLACGDKRSVCLEIADQFKARQSVKWKW